MICNRDYTKIAIFVSDMQKFIIVSNKDKVVYEGVSKNSRNAVNVYMSRLRKGKLGNGKLWWLQQMWDACNGEGFESHWSVGMGMNKLGEKMELGYNVYSDDKLPKKMVIEPNIYIPELYLDSVQELVDLFDEGIFTLEDFSEWSKYWRNIKKNKDG